MPRLFSWPIFCLLALFAAGCSNAPITVDVPLEPTHERLLRVAQAYQKANFELQRAPRDIQELKLTDPESMRSPRDGEPFVVCWGFDLFQPAGNSTPVLAYEKHGKDGRRFVINVMSAVRELNESEFQQATFPEGHEPLR
ncbi:MAG: hypothetical protein AB7K24_31825 [Gemmataceae bacterium]